jgi:hypothetical protein
MLISMHKKYKAFCIGRMAYQQIKKGWLILLPVLWIYVAGVVTITAVVRWICHQDFGCQTCRRVGKTADR